jgi:hypothetical protein
VLISLVVGWAVTLHLSQGYWGRQFNSVSAYDSQQILPTAAFVAANTQPDELVALAGQDWDPSIFYYARRKGVMVRADTGPRTPAELRALGAKKLFRCPGSSGAAAPCDIVDLTAP